MKWFICVFIAALLLGVCALPTYGAIATSQWFIGEQNQSSDNDYEYLIDLDNNSPTASNGDLFIGGLSFQTNEDLTGTGGTSFYSTNTIDELVAVFALELTNKRLQVAGDPSKGYYFDFIPVTAAKTLQAVNAGAMSAGLKNYLDGWGAGSLFAVYSDPAKNAAGTAGDFTRVFNTQYPGIYLGPGPDGIPGTADDVYGDDGDPNLIGADIGVNGGLFLAEEQLLTSAYDWTTPNPAVLVMELGFVGGAPDGVGEGFLAAFSTDNVQVARGIAAPATAGSTDWGVNVTVPGVVPSSMFDPVNTIFGTAQFSGSAGVKGIGPSNTPYDVFTNADVVFHPIPEPASVVIWGLLGGLGLVLARRRLKK